MPAQELLKTVLFDNPSLEAYWRFESGALTTDSKGSNTLTNNSSVGEAEGVYGGAADFSGSNYFNIASNADINPVGTTPFSVGCWVKMDTGAEDGIISKGLAGNSTFQWALYSTSASTFTFIISNGGTWGGTNTAITATGWTYATGVWYHLVATYDGSVQRLYINGRMVGSTAGVSGGVKNATGDLYIGSFYDTSNYKMDGKVDEAFLLNGVCLSSYQVKELYEGKLLAEGYPQAGLVGLWHFNKVKTDTSGNNNHLGDIVAPSAVQGGFVGKLGLCASFNGSDQGLTIVSPTNCNNSDLSIMALVKKSSSGGAATMGIHSYYKEAGGSGRYGYRFTETSTDKLYLEIDSADGDYGVGFIGLSSATSLVDDVWTFVCGTFDRSNIKLYINGNLDASVAWTQAPRYSSNNFTVGYENYGASTGAFYYGLIDELRLYNRALSAREIRLIADRIFNRLD